MQNKEEKTVSYIGVTETPDTKGSKEQINRLYTRYKFASEFCIGKEVLEVACGPGQGLGYLSLVAKKVVGSDIDEKLIKLAESQYVGKINVELKLGDANALPFKNDSFDVVILYEAIYYLKEPRKFIREAKRVLRNGGILIICTANKDWEDFNPSPYSFRYFSIPELSGLLENAGFTNIKIFGDCPVEKKNIKDKIVSLIKKLAVKFHLIPKTMKGKEIFKRIFMGKLIPLPSEIKDAMAEYTPPVSIPNNITNTCYKVIFAVSYISK